MKTKNPHWHLLLMLVTGFSLVAAAQVRAQTFTNLHNFAAASLDSSGYYTNSDGGVPSAGLILSGGALYGTAEYGGTNGFGTVFKVNPNGTGFTTLHAFTGGNDGANPQAGLVLSGNTLYGTAQYGGTNDNGTVFEVTTNGTGFASLYSFMALDANGNNSDGANPLAGLVLSGGTLYGTAQYGGTNGNGTVFRVNTNGAGFTSLHSFTALDSVTQTTNSDGADPVAGLVLSGATLYGTAQYGGTNGDGTVFSVNTNGTGFATAYAFTGGNDGAYPTAGLTLSGNTLYGTTPDGGGFGSGTVFAVNTNGAGFMSLYNFAGGYDGANPEGVLVLSGNMLFGTANSGGGFGSGAVFAANTNGAGFATLYSFTAGLFNAPGIFYTNSDGTGPNTVILSGNILYGTALNGGINGNGTVYDLATNSSANDQLFGRVLDGSGNPIAGVYVYAYDGLGHLYAGTTDAGGHYSFNLSDGNWDVSVNCNQLSALHYNCFSDQYTNISGGSHEVDFTVQPLCVFQVITTNLPVGIVNVYYDQFLQASVCNPPFTWSAISGSLPSNLQLSPSGELTGTPTNSGIFNFPVYVTDSNQNTTNRIVALNVVMPPSTATTVSQPALSNRNFQFNLGGVGGQYYTVQFSTNLMNWVTLFNTNLAGNSNNLVVAPGTNQAGFYRAFESGVVITDAWSGPISAAPVFSFSNYVSDVDVPNSKVTVGIVRAGGFTNQVCINYSTSDGTARAGVDYTPVSGTLCFDPNQTNASITIPLLMGTNSPSSETLDLVLFNPKCTTVFKSSILILFPQLLGTWYGSWTGTNGALICDGAILVPPPYGGGGWTLVMQQVDWPARTAVGTFFAQGNEYAWGITNNCALCCQTELFPAYETSQIVSNIVVDSSGHVTIGGPTSNLSHGGFVVFVPNPGPDMGVDFEFDTFNEIVQGSFTSEFGSIVGGSDSGWSHIGWVSGRRIAPTQ